MPLITRIQVYRGVFINLPLLAQGELAFCTDTKEVWIGDGVTNRLVGAVRIADGDKGDITVADDGSSWHINARAVGAAELVAVDTERLLGRQTAGPGDVEEVTVNQVLDWIAGTPADGDLLVRGASDWSRLAAAPSPYHQLGDTASPATAWTPCAPIILEDQKAANTAGGSSAAASWQGRTLNTKVTDTENICTLFGNAFSLPKGLYHIVARAPSYNCGMNRLRIRETAFGATYEGQGVFGQTTSISLAIVDKVIAVNSGHNLVIEHYTTVAQATNGLGVQMNDGAAEIYTQVTITPIALLP